MQNSNCISMFFLYWISSYSMLVVIWYLYWFGGKVKLVQLLCTVSCEYSWCAVYCCVLLFCSELAGLFGGQFASWSPWRLGSTRHTDLCPQCTTGKWRLHYRLHLLTLVTLVYIWVVLHQYDGMRTSPGPPPPLPSPSFPSCPLFFFFSFLSHTDLNQRANAQKLCCSSCYLL